jgi:transcriptional regulator with XRE-family HTH domain
VPAKPGASGRSARNARSDSKQQPQAHVPPDEPSEFGKRLRSYRDDRDLSLSALADQTGLSKGYLSSLETQHQARRPSAEVLYALAQALGVTMSDLMGRKLLAAAAPTVPPSLAEYAEEDDLTEADIAMLASIQFRGEQPKTAARWRYIYQSIRGSTRLDE